jgi:hypothetical protein
MNTISNFDILVQSVGEIVDAHIEAKLASANTAIAAWYPTEVADKRLVAFRQYVLEKSLKTISEYTFK